MNMGLGKGAEDGSDSIIDARDIIIVFLQEGETEAANSVYGDRPNDKGEYDSGHQESKDRREAYAEYIEIFTIHDEEVGSYPSLEVYLIEKCQEIMVDPETRWRAVMDFIEREFGIKVELVEESTDFYDGCMEGLAEQINKTNGSVTVDDVKALLPFKQFNGYGEGKIGDAVREVLYHFRKGTDE